MIAVVAPDQSAYGERAASGAHRASSMRAFIRDAWRCRSLTSDHVLFFLDNLRLLRSTAGTIGCFQVLYLPDVQSVQRQRNRTTRSSSPCRQKVSPTRDVYLLHPMVLAVAETR